MGRNGKQRDAISGKNDEMRLQNGAAENSVLHLLKKKTDLSNLVSMVPYRRNKESGFTLIITKNTHSLWCPAMNDGSL